MATFTEASMMSADEDSTSSPDDDPYDDTDILNSAGTDEVTAHLAAAGTSLILTSRKKINILWLQNSKQRILFFLGHAKLYTNKNCWIMKGSLNLPVSVAVTIVRCLQMNSRWRQCTTLCSSVTLLQASLFPLQHIYLIIYMLIIFQNPCKK